MNWVLKVNFAQNNYKKQSACSIVMFLLLINTSYMPCYMCNACFPSEKSKLPKGSCESELYRLLPFVSERTVSESHPEHAVLPTVVASTTRSGWSSELCIYASCINKKHFVSVVLNRILMLCLKARTYKGYSSNTQQLINIFSCRGKKLSYFRPPNLKKI